MGCKFVALPVNRGDAFYLRKCNYNFLIDGGGNKSSFSKLFLKYIKTRKLDVVVCTHNDEDHANGIIDIIENKSVSIDEIWLPATWSWRFRDIMIRPDDFFNELVQNIVDFDKSYHGKNLDDVYISICDNIYRIRSEENKIIYYPEEIIHFDTYEWVYNIIKFSYNQQLDDIVCKYHYLEHVLKHNYILLRECLLAASRIKKIFIAAVKAHIRIRLFEFVTDVQKISGGLPGLLEPVNSQEIIPYNNPKKFINYANSNTIQALYFLALTKTNKESLVFYSPEQTTCPGVLFTADSDLAYGLTHIKQPSKDLIATAPHHGSEANASIYKKVNQWAATQKIIWVRSDNHSKKRPGKTFKSQPTRLCTLCNPPILPKQCIEINCYGSGWKVTPNTRLCSCQ